MIGATTEMRCPAEVAAILSEIIERGILRIRAHAGDADRCFREADHIHNLPGLLRDFSWPRLLYYWDAERASFMAQVPEPEREWFEPLWRELFPFVAWGREVSARSPSEGSHPGDDA